MSLLQSSDRHYQGPIISTRRHADNEYSDKFEISRYLRRLKTVVKLQRFGTERDITWNGYYITKNINTERICVTIVLKQDAMYDGIILSKNNSKYFNILTVPRSSSSSLRVNILLKSYIHTCIILYGSIPC